MRMYTDGGTEASLKMSELWTSAHLQLCKQYTHSNICEDLELKNTLYWSINLKATGKVVSLVSQ